MTLKYATNRCDKWKNTVDVWTFRIDLSHIESLESELEIELEMYHLDAFSDRHYEEINVFTMKSKRYQTRIRSFVTNFPSNFKSETT